MKSWMLDEEGGRVHLVERSAPELRAGGVVLRMLAVQIPAYTRALVQGGRGGIATPTVLGIGGIGRVEQVADDVHTVAVGDVAAATGFLSTGRTSAPQEVLLGWTGIGGRGVSTPSTDAMRRTWRDGTFAERALIPGSTVVALPGAETFTDVARLAFLPWLAVAAGAVDRAGIRPGDNVVIIGASGQMGGGAVLLALANGAGQVAAVGRDQKNLQRLADIDPRVRSVVSTGERATDAAAITAALGAEADVVLDALGPAPTADLTMAGFDVLTVDGTMVVLGGVRETLPIPYGELMRRRLTLKGSWMMSNDTVLAVWNQIRAGVIDLSPLEVHTTGLDSPADALARAETFKGLAYLALVP